MQDITEPIAVNTKRTDYEPTDLRFMEYLAEFGDFNITKHLGLVTGSVTAPTTPSQVLARVPFSESFQPMAEFLYTLLPVWLNYFYEVEFDTRLGKRMFKTPQLKALCAAAEAEVKTVKCSNTIVRNHFKLISKAATTEENIEYFEDILILLKTKYYKTLSDLDKRVFLHFIKLVSSEDLPEDRLQKILQAVNSLDNKEVRKLAKSIDNDTNDVKAKLKETTSAAKKVTKKHFKTDTPSVDQITKFRKKHPDLYKEWRKVLNDQRAYAKAALENEWLDTFGDTSRPVADARKILKSLRIEDPIDKGFKGMVGLGRTPASMFIYFTKDGKLLNNTPGTRVQMNPAWKPGKDDCYYCKSIPTGSITDKFQMSYTIENRRKSNGYGFSIAQEVSNVIEDVRIQSRKDLKAKDKDKRIAATIVVIGDLCCCRIGNRKSEREEKTFGIHNLKLKHLTFKGKKAILEYPGKGYNKMRDDKKRLQHHEITDEQIVGMLKILKGKKKKEQYIFSQDGDKPLRPDFINGYLQKELGFPGGYHKFRKYHASRIFFEEANKVRKKKKMTPKEYKEAYKGMLQKVSDVLGNTPAVCQKSYISPEHILKFHQDVNLPIPKSLQKVLQESYLADKELANL